MSWFNSQELKAFAFHVAECSSSQIHSEFDKVRESDVLLIGTAVHITGETPFCCSLFCFRDHVKPIGRCFRLLFTRINRPSSKAAWFQVISRPLSHPREGEAPA